MPLAHSTRLASEVLTAVKRQFGDESGAQITDTDIYRWINQGQTEIARKGEVNRSTATTVSVVGQAEYTFSSTNIFKLLSITYKDRPLEYMSFEQAQESILSYPNIPNDNGEPTNWYEFDTSLFLYPTPNVAGDTIKIYIVLAPVAVTTSTDVLSIPDTHYNALVQYVLQQAYELDDDLNSANFKGRQLEESLQGLSSTSNSKYYPTITVLPEDQ